jgi:hypothetical protein
MQKYIIEPNNADVFLHMNYAKGDFEKSHANNGTCTFPKDYDLAVLKAYKPLRWMVEAPRDFKCDLRVPPLRVARFMAMNAHKGFSEMEMKAYMIRQVLSMFYSISKSLELCNVYALETGVHYDYVVRARFDCVPKKELACKRYDPGYLWYQEFGQPDHLVFDWLNFGSPQIIHATLGSVFACIQYLNSPRFYPIAERLPNTYEPSDACGPFNEGMIRDMAHRLKIPTRAFDVGLCLGVNEFDLKQK